MITLEGAALSPGVARGVAITVRPAAAGASSPPDDGRPALEQFKTARRNAAAELRCALDSLAGADGPAPHILRAHLALLGDPMLIAAVETRIASNRVGALAALEQTAAALASRFEAVADPAIRQRSADVRDVCEYITRHLTGSARSPAARVSGIICAADLSPAQVLRFSQDRPLAFVLESGTETSHAAILMRALAVPAVIGVRGVTALVQDGDLLVVDADGGKVFVNPDSTASPPASVVTSVAVGRSDPEPASTRDGVAIAVTATIADAADARRAIAAGADGIGLFRSETLFLRSEHPPSPDAQQAFYRDVAAAVASRPLTVRLLDLGADKQAPGVPLAEEPNPALGLRGVRLLLARPDLFGPHLHALLRARADAVRLRVLVPMVVDATDLTRVRELIGEAARGAPNVPLVDVGAMVETPAAALMADELAAVADFLSIGTNDLVQYILAADRDSARMAPYYQSLHPAVLRLVRGVVSAAARRGIPVSACGETAADPHAIPIFVGMGVTELSVRASAIARVKAQVRRLARTAARALAEEVAMLPTAAAVRARIDAASETETGIDVRETCHPR